jgi:hypothetical protein
MTPQRLIFKPEELILHARKKRPSSCSSITASRASYLSRRRITSRSCSGRRLARSFISRALLAKSSDPSTLLRKGREPANEQMSRNQSEWRALQSACYGVA